MPPAGSTVSTSSASSSPPVPAAPPRGLQDLFYRQLTHLNLRRWEECVTLIEWLAPASGERILDIGCGDGWWDHRIAAKGAHVVGVDINERALAVAAKRNKTPLTEFHSANAEALPFPDGSFNKAISMCVIEHFVNEDAVLGEIARVLKPGAPFILSADSLTNPGIKTEERAVHRRRYAVNTFYDIDLLREKLARAGFELEHAHYILTTPLTLAIVRASWKLDDMAEGGGGPVRVALAETGLFLLNIAGRLAIAASEKVARRADSGLTILARARRRTAS
jgi:ubiquinone/menaquinone biosynthesis C-methylase UbiE